MPTNFPGAIDTTATHPNSAVNGGVIPAATDNNHSDAIIAIETELGINPSGGASTVKARLDQLVVNVRDYGATGDGTTDDTAAFVAARDALTDAFGVVTSDAIDGAILYVPPGTYRIGDLDISTSFQSIRGAGISSTLKAKTGATYVLKIEGKRQVEIADLSIHGNAKASKGIKIAGSASVSSELNSVTRCRITQCSTGIDIVTAAVDQVDKNTYTRCQFIDNDKGMVVNSTNGQQQLLIGCTFDAGVTYGIELTNGSVEMVGGQFQTAGSTAIKLNGTTIQWLNLMGVIFEGHATAIDGSTHWPLNGVILNSCVVESTVGGKTVRMGVATPPSVLYANQCQFVNGDLDASATDAIFFDVFNRFTSGATVTGGTQFRRMKWWQDGLALTGTVVAQPPVGSMVPVTAKGASGQTGNLFEARQDNGTLMTYIGANGGLRVWPSASETDSLTLYNSAGTSMLRVNLDGSLQFDNSIATGSAANKSLFRNSADDRLTYKNNSGDITALEAVGMRRPVRVASTANLTLTAPGATIDGVTMASGDRMLVKDQTTASQNGIYVWNGAASTATRATDSDTAAKLTDSLVVTVDEGTFNADTIWSLSTPKPITVGTTALRFGRVMPGYNFATRDPWSHGGNAIAATMDRNDVQNLITQTAITAICSFHGGMVVPAGRLITNINAFCTAAGSGAVTLFWWALVRQSDRVVLQRTANSTTLPTVDAVHTRALQAAITLDYDTPCYIALATQVATTSPSFAGVTGLATSNFASPILTGNSSTTPTSTPPTVGAVLGAPAAGNTGRIHAWLS